MKSSCLWLMAVGCMLIASCATTPRQEPKLASCADTPAQDPKLAPWGLSKATFPELLVSFGAANLPEDPDKTVYKYVWSQSGSYDRYEATREAHGDMAPLMQEATKQIHAGAQALACKEFIDDLPIALLSYDAARGGFPVDAQWYRDWNRPQAVINLDGSYGYRRAEIRIPRDGWTLPATQEQGQQIWQAIWDPIVRGKRFFRGIGVYTLDRCDQDPQQSDVLQCTGTLRKFYAYAHPPLQPVYELVKEREAHS